MKMWNDEQPGDLVTFEMKVQEVSRRVLQQMFLSKQETIIAYEKALENAIKNFDYVSAFQKEANEAVKNSVNNYFKYGEGNTIIQEATKKALTNFFEKSTNGEKECEK